jgi:hypothetical protein
MIDTSSSMSKNSRVRRYLEEFYSQKVNGFVEERQFRRSLGSRLPQLIIAVALFLSVPFMVGMSEAPRILRIRAGTESQNVSLFLFPKEVQSHPNGTFLIAVKGVGPEGKKVGSVTFSLVYDPMKVRVLSIKNDGVEKNTQILKATDIQTANVRGNMKLIIGAFSENTAPSGAFNLPQVTFESIQSGESTIRLENEESQVVFLPQEVGIVSAVSDTRVRSTP